MKLVERYNWINLPILSGIFMLSGLCIFLSIHHLLITRFDDSLQEQANMINQYVAAHHNLPIQGRTDEWRFSFVPTQNKRQGPSYEFVEFLDPGDGEHEKFRQLSYTIAVGKTRYLISISKSLEPLQGLSQSIALITLASMAVAILLTLLSNQVLLKRLWAPFYSTLDVLKTYTLGHESPAEFSKTSTEEFILLNRHIAELFIKADREYAVLKEFTENASHELQTPLSILRSKLDLIVQDENLNAAQLAALGDAYHAVGRMSSLSKSLLLLSKIENSQYSDIAQVNVKNLIQNKIRQMEDIWQHRQLELDLELEDAFMAANPQLLEILIANLLGNAGRHNRTGGNIGVYLRSGELRIANTGNSLPLDAGRMFSRFYRPFGTTDSSSTGLGLSIIKEICNHSQIAISYEFTDGLHRFLLEW